jgi:hypothetical protein
MKGVFKYSTWPQLLHSSGTFFQMLHGFFVSSHVLHNLLHSLLAKTKAIKNGLVPLPRVRAATGVVGCCVLHRFEPGLRVGIN